MAVNEGNNLIAATTIKDNIGKVANKDLPKATKIIAKIITPKTIRVSINNSPPSYCYC